MSLEKTIWLFKVLKEEDLFNENIEIILNIFEMNRFELNFNMFKSEFKFDVDEVFNYPCLNPEKVNDEIDNCFNSKYHHSLFTGIVELDETTNFITFHVEKIFTNEEESYNTSNDSLEAEYEENSSITFSKDSWLVKQLNLSSSISYPNLVLKIQNE